MERWIKTQQRLAAHRQQEGRGHPTPGMALPAHHHSQHIPNNNHPGYNPPLCSAHQARKLMIWVAFFFFSGARDRNCSPHSACARRASLLPAPWGTVWRLWEAFQLVVSQSSPFLAQLFLAIIQGVVYAKGMPTQKSLTHPSCFQPCWQRTRLSLPTQRCRINALLTPSFTPSKAGGNICSSHPLKCLLQGPIFGSS